MVIRTDAHFALVIRTDTHFASLIDSKKVRLESALIYSPFLREKRTF